MNQWTWRNYALLIIGSLWKFGSTNEGELVLYIRYILYIYTLYIYIFLLFCGARWGPFLVVLARDEPRGGADEALEFAPKSNFFKRRIEPPSGDTVVNTVGPHMVNTVVVTWEDNVGRSKPGVVSRSLNACVLKVRIKLDVGCPVRKKTVLKSD